MKVIELETLLDLCEGVKSVQEPGMSWIHQYQTGVVIVPDDIYIEINSTATNGTIGKLVDIDLDTSDDADRRIYSWATTFIIQVDGKETTNRIRYGHSNIMVGYTGPTVYKRTVKKSTNEEIPPHVNKFKQTINKGDWICGIGPSKTFYFGQVLRWTKSSVFVTPVPDNKKVKHHCISLPRESLVLPGHPKDYEQMVTMLILGGAVNI